MTALDTNVIVRFLVRDDEKQARLVHARFKQAEAVRETFFIPLPVVLETIWVLESVYDTPRKAILEALDELKDMPVLEFEKPQVLQQLLEDGRSSRADLSDLLIGVAAQACHCEGCLTFDRKAARHPFFRLLA